METLLRNVAEGKVTSIWERQRHLTGDVTIQDKNSLCLAISFLRTEGTHWSAIQSLKSLSEEIGIEMLRNR